jgi:hypothetical protein
MQKHPIPVAHRPVNEWGETQGAVWTFTTGSGADESFESGGFAAYENG